jgi:hypothetical protein
MKSKTIKGRGNVVPLPPPHLRAAYLRRIRIADAELREAAVIKEPPSHGPATHDIKADRPELSPRIQ